MAKGVKGTGPWGSKPPPQITVKRDGKSILLIIRLSAGELLQLILGGIFPVKPTKSAEAAPKKRRKYRRRKGKEKPTAE